MGFKEKNMTLKELNFKKLIQLDIKNIENYCFKDYFKNECHHKNIIGYCTSCEEKGINILMVLYVKLRAKHSLLMEWRILYEKSKSSC